MMNSPEENIQALTRAILNEAQAEAEEAKAEAQSKADVLRQRAQQQAEAERKAILERAGQEAERLRSQAIATSQLKARALELEHREKLLGRVFKTVREQLPAVQQRKDYDQIAIQLLREALIQLKAGQAEVRADKSAQKFLTDRVLEELSKELKAELSIGKPLEQGIGVVVEASDGHLHYDNTLETRLNRLQNGLRSSVYRILMGEKL
jgi:vacuolar-type H+-ATPase subunit E/Vma4